MATEVRRERVLANFKPPKSVRVKAKAKRSKDKRVERPGNSEAHLAALRQLPCCIPGCSKHPCGQAHHIKATGLSDRGMALRSPDRWAIPICHEHHINGVERVGSRNELEWFSKRGLSPLDLAQALWSATGNLPKMIAITIAHKRGF